MKFKFKLCKKKISHKTAGLVGFEKAMLQDVAYANIFTLIDCWLQSGVTPVVIYNKLRKLKSPTLKCRIPIEIMSVLHHFRCCKIFFEEFSTSKFSYFIQR